VVRSSKQSSVSRQEAVGGEARLPFLSSWLIDVLMARCALPYLTRHGLRAKVEVTGIRDLEKEAIKFIINGEWRDQSK
jgi:hypothetical protein